MIRSIKELIRKYSLELTAATFLIVDHDDTSLDIACLWQKCMGGKVRAPSVDFNAYTANLSLIIVKYKNPS